MGTKDLFWDSTSFAEHEIWITRSCIQVSGEDRKLADCVLRGTDLVVPKGNFVHCGN